MSIDPFDPHRVPPYPPHPPPQVGLNHLNGNPVIPSQNFISQQHYVKLPTPFGNEYQGSNGPHYVHAVNPGYGSSYSPISVPYPSKVENKLEGAHNSSDKSHEGPYKHWEQPPDGMIHESQVNSAIPSRPSSAHEKHRATPDRRTPGRSPGLVESSHQHGPLINGPNGLQTMPQMPTAPYPGGHMYSQPPMYGMGAPPPPYITQNNQPNMPFNVGYPVETGKKIRLAEPDSLLTEPNRTGPSQVSMENSFQVPSASRHPFNGTIPQAAPPMNSHNVAQPPMRMSAMAEHWDQSANHQNSNLMANAPLPSTPISGQSASKSPTSDTDKVTKKKRKRCGNCPGCLRKDNCGDCGPCKSIRSHQICKMRKCDQLKTKKEKVREVRISATLGSFASFHGLPLASAIV